MLKHHLKTIFRLFYRNRAITLINFFGISIGIASLIIIGNWVYIEFSFDGFHENKDRIYRLIEKQNFKGQDEKYLSSMPEWLIGTFEEEIKGVEASTGLLGVGNLWFGDAENRVEARNVTFTDNSIFKIFSFTFIAGSPENALSNPQSAVISESFAKRLFADRSPVGQSILHKDGLEYVVTAVIEDIPDNSHFQADILVSIEGRKASWNRRNYNHTTSIYLLLDQNTDPEGLTQALQAHKNKYMEIDATSIEFLIQPLSDLHLYSRHTIWGQNHKKSDIALVYMFIVIGILIVAISTINYVNLATASTSKRYREFGLKKVVGSGKINLIFQFLLEAFLLLFISFWVSLLFVEIANSLLRKFDILDQPNLIYHEFWFYPVMFGFVLLLSVFAGIYPAIILSSVKPVALFKKNFNVGSRGIAFKRILVIVQLSITCLHIISALYIGKQIHFMKNKELGYSSEAVINIWSNQKIRNHYHTIKNDLKKHMAINGITSTNIPFGNSMWRTCIHFEGKSEGEDWVTPYMMTDYNFTDFYSIKIVEGRGFDQNFALDKEGRAFLVNASLARKMGDKNIIGRKFRTCNAPWGEIVGVVDDFNYRSLHHDVEPLAIQLGQNYNNLISVRANADNIHEALSLLKNIWKEYRPDEPFQCSLLDGSLNDLYHSEEKIAKIEIIFCIVSIILSCIGLLGLFLFVTERKTKEIGIRKVNGASMRNILELLSRELVINTLVALFISIPVGWIALKNWSNNFAYKTNISWWIFGLSGIAIFILTWLTVGYFTIRAARKNPVEALRYE